MQFKGVIFDLDDTLWDFHANSQLALQVVWQEMGRYGNVNIDSFEDFLNIYQGHNTRLWREYRQGERTSASINIERFYLSARDIGVSLSLEERKAVADLFLRELYNGKILIEGAIELLEWLKPKYSMGLITNGFAAGLKRLDTCGLAQYFKAVVCSEDFGYPKPNTGIFLHTVEQMGGKPEEFVYIGDNYEGDIIGARNAGLSAIYFNLRSNDYSKYDIKPNAVVTSLAELKMYL